MWTVKDDYHTSGAIEALEYQGNPVLVSHAGYYPTLVSDEGLSTRDIPYIKISVGGYSRITADTSIKYYNSVSVMAYGQWENGRRRGLNVWHHETDDQFTPDALIAEAEQHLDEAASILRSLDDTYEAAYAQLRPLDALPHTLSREAYLTACQKLSAEVLSDAQCDSYGVIYGRFEFPEYQPEHILKMSLAYKRLQGIGKAQALAKDQLPPPVPPSPPKQTGQLWEPCPHCGEEPVYMPLHVCEKCWPK